MIHDTMSSSSAECKAERRCIQGLQAAKAAKPKAVKTHDAHCITTGEDQSARRFNCVHSKLKSEHKSVYNSGTHKRVDH